MKKMIFAVLATFVMSLTMISCGGEKAPEDKMIGLMEDMVSLVKDTHIKSADDVKTFALKMKDIQSTMEKLQKEVGEDYELPEDKEKELEEKVGKLTEQLMPELQRVMQEAKDADIDPEDLEELKDLF